MDPLGAGTGLAVHRCLAGQAQRLRPPAARAHERRGRATALEPLLLAAQRTGPGPGLSLLALAENAPASWPGPARAARPEQRRAPMPNRVIINADGAGLRAEGNASIVRDIG